MRLFRLLGPLCLTVPLAFPQNLKEFEKNVTEFTLPNGLHFIVLQRPQAPIVSMVTRVNVGSANDPAGRTGLAHMFEHMAFKGTDTLGTTNWLAEKKVLAEIETLYDKIDAEKNKGPRANKETLAKLEQDVKAAIKKADGFVDKEAYSRIISKNGGVGMNAGTSVESTTYFYSLPSNRVELWFLLTSQVLKAPIMREFYKERDVVREERRMRVESDPQGKMVDMLRLTAFMAHPQRSLIGWATDIENLRANEAETFFKKYYTPANMVMVLSGDVDPKEIRRLADTYFAGLPAAPPPPRILTEEPKQEGERRVAIETETQPILWMAYKRPTGIHPDDAPISVLANILSSGRTGAMYKEMVEERKVALAAALFPNVFGDKFDGLLTFVALPAVGKTIDDNEKAINEIIERVKTKPFDDAAINRAKTKMRASLIRGLDSNMGLAMQLADNHQLYGDWRKLFTQIDDIEKVTAADLMRVAKTYFTNSGLTVVYSKNPKGASK